MSLQSYDIVVVGSGNAALCAGIAALDGGAKVLIVEKADEKEWGGNSRYTAGAMRFYFESFEDLKPLIRNLEDSRLPKTDFGSYPKEKFIADLKHFNNQEPLTELQEFLVEQSLPALQWLGKHNIKFDPSYARQSFLKNGIHTFWGGLALDVEGEGDGLVHAEMQEYLRLGGDIMFATAARKIIKTEGKVTGIRCLNEGKPIDIVCKAVVLGCGGFEANKTLREKYLGKQWGNAKVRGTRHNLGEGLDMAQEVGAVFHGFFGGCHAVPMDKNMPDYGNLELPFIERKNYRKISYLFGLMLNENGKRFVDEGLDMRNYTYAQFGKAVIEEPNQVAWQFFDEKVASYLYAEYRVSFASKYEANTIEGLIEQLDGIDKEESLKTIKEYNEAAQFSHNIPFDPTQKDGKTTKGLSPNKTNWANALDTPPFKAFPVTSGITFTYGGVKINKKAEVLDEASLPILGLYACGEMVGGIFFHGYPGGSGLTSGTVYGRCAGTSAAEFIKNQKQHN